MQPEDILVIYCNLHGAVTPELDIRTVRLQDGKIAVSDIETLLFGKPGSYYFILQTCHSGKPGPVPANVAPRSLVRQSMPSTRYQTALAVLFDLSLAVCKGCSYVRHSSSSAALTPAPVKLMK